MTTMTLAEHDGGFMVSLSKWPKDHQPIRLRFEQGMHEHARWQLTKEEATNLAVELLDALGLSQVGIQTIRLALDDEDLMAMFDSVMEAAR